MGGSELQIEQLHGLIDRIQRGDETACDELVRQITRRVELMTRNLFKQFPGVHRWEDTSDVLQMALLRVLTSLRQTPVRPESMRDFCCMAANRIRSVLIDLARHYYGPQGLGANNSSVEGFDTDGEGKTNPSAREAELQSLERWTRFHEAVERLPPAEREVMSLIFYHGWTQAEVAELLQVSDRMVRKHWQRACQTLHDLLGGDMP
jgi:RNA polymerase sigma factor (sigma-70 family)